MHNCADMQLLDIEIDKFKALSDSTRLRILTLLVLNDETCVCHLAESLNEADFKVSRHLGILKRAGLVESRRDGTWIYYKCSKENKQFLSFFKKYIKGMLVDHKILESDHINLSKIKFKLGSC
jgi:DNA-binding transcriptional ArsR family regulator